MSKQIKYRQKSKTVNQQALNKQFVEVSVLFE